MSSIKTTYLPTGNHQVDLLNFDLFKLYDHLLNTCSTGRGSDVLDSLFSFLDNYTASHFPDEEALMIKYDYPDSSYHQFQHEAFYKLVTQLKDKYKNEGSNKKLIAEIISFLTYWLNVHIKQSDIKLVSYINSNDYLPIDIF